MKEVLKNIKKFDVSLVITEKHKWDNIAECIDKNKNPTTFEIWNYISNNYEIKKAFGSYYILNKKVNL